MRTCGNAYIECCPRVDGHDGKCGSPLTLLMALSTAAAEIEALKMEIAELKRVRT